jgi:3-hydroxyisobutyrate dehydrogenase-like beta-hydroxyacid dehydrogenase
MHSNAPDRPAPRAGVVGLGMIGGGVAISLARKGRVPVVYDIAPEAVARLDGTCLPAGSASEVAASSDVVLLAVVDAEQAREALSGPRGVLAGAHPGLTVVLLCTVALPVVLELARRCADAGVSLLDCGVTPGDKAAENGMVAILGGDQGTVDAAMPVLEDFAKKVVHCGPLGAGMATKIARNVITYGTWRAVHEATALAEASGVDPAKVVEVIEQADPEWTTLLSWQRNRLTGDPNIRALIPQVVRLLDKDLGAAQELAAQLGVPVPLVDVTRGHGAETLEFPEEKNE